MALFSRCTSLWSAVVILACAGGASAAPSVRVPLRAAFAGLAIDVNPGYVRVSEILHVHNGTKQTFVGDVGISLPPGAQFVTFHEGWQRPTLSGQRLRDHLTVRPGTHRLTYAYSLRGAGTVRLDRDVTMPTDLLEIFTLAPAETRGPILKPAPPAVSEGRTFTRASARAVPPGRLVLRVVGVPTDQRWPAPAAAAVLATALVLGLGVAVARTRGRPSRA